MVNEFSRNLSAERIIKTTAVRQAKQDYTKLTTKCENTRANSARATTKEVINEFKPPSSNDNSLLKRLEQLNKEKNTNTTIQKLIKRCPYIEKLRQTSETYKQSLIMIETLARYNNLLKQLMTQDIKIRSDVELEKFNEFIKENRNLRIQLKYILSEQDENQRNIDRAKEDVFSIKPRISVDSLSKNYNSNANRELIKFRDYLLKDNDELLFKLKLKLT